MAWPELDTENGDFDLTSQQTVLTHTPSATEIIRCQAYLALGDGDKNVHTDLADIELTIEIGSQTIIPAAEQIRKAAGLLRPGIWTPEFTVPANTAVTIKLKSTNANDTDVDVSAWLYDVGLSAAALAKIADVVLDELLSGHSGAGSLGKAVADIEDDAHKAKAAACNKTEDNLNTGQRKIYDDNGTDVLVTLERESADSGKIVREVPV